MKIIRSDASKESKELAINYRIFASSTSVDHLVTLLDHFKHVGPNGKHDCLVFEPMGPDVATYFQRSIPCWQGRSIGKQLLKALQCLHDLKIAHCDTNPGNLLLAPTHSIQDLCEEDNYVPLQSDGKHCHTPRYIHEDRPLTELLDHTRSLILKLSDFGAAFFFDAPPDKPLMALALRAPEVVLQSRFDHTIDIWSFGCLLFEVFTGQPLFSLLDVNFERIDNDAFAETQDDDHLLQMTSTLGPLPPAMFEKWPRRMRYFDADLKLVRTDVGKSQEPQGPVYVGKTLEQRFRKSRPPSMTAEEADAIVEVLRSALQYDPALRPSATKLLSLGWFSCI
ncbi:hypothetical protein KVT40_009280 [Elsinoe batatas]|uniref:Protein kinase domain-containing protein n=1 Tax=Elsinoe batatas TaxID=2601811 RepID=A0A8K0PEP7_9PEZI|nr:hypothetical protein KVT40_009280 [Elsinoe batatas]